MKRDHCNVIWSIVFLYTFLMIGGKTNLLAQQTETPPSLSDKILSCTLSITQGDQDRDGFRQLHFVVNIINLGTETLSMLMPEPGMNLFYQYRDVKFSDFFMSLLLPGSYSMQLEAQSLLPHQAIQYESHNFSLSPGEYDVYAEYFSGSLPVQSCWTKEAIPEGNSLLMLSFAFPNKQAKIGDRQIPACQSDGQPISPHVGTAPIWYGKVQSNVVHIRVE